MLDAIKQAKVELEIRLSRRRAFQALFDLEGDRRVEAERFLAWMRDYCFAQRSTEGANAEETARNNGRRDVWLAIHAVMNFDETEISKLVEAHDDYFGTE